MFAATSRRLRRPKTALAVACFAVCLSLIGLTPHADDRTEFVYLLAWPDTQTMERSWAQFLADEEWIRIKKETGAIHGPLVGEIEDRTLRLVPYSPERLHASR